MIDHTMLRYQENTMRWLSDRMIRNTVKTLLKTAYKEATKGILSLAKGSVEDTVKKSVIRDAVDNAIRSRLDRLTESQEFVQNIACCLMKMPTCTAPISMLVKRRTKIAVTNRVKFYGPSTNLERRTKRWHNYCPCSDDPRFYRQHPNMTRRRNPKWRRKSPTLLDRGASRAARAIVALKNIRSNIAIKVQKLSVCYGR